MKHAMVRWVVFTVVCSCFIWSYPGEFMIYQVGTPQLLSLHLQSSGNAWSWSGTAEEGHVIFASPYNASLSDYSFGFDYPKNVNVAPDGVMPWGLMQFTLTCSTASINFTIDFRDERWADYSGGPDIILYFNPATGETYLDPPTGSNVTVSGSSTINIWDAYHQGGSPVTSGFLPPIFLENRINGANAGGTLKIGGTNYNSGDIPLLAYETNYTIGTNNERFANYQSSGITYKHNNWSQTASDYLLTRSKTITSENNHQDANFVSLSPAVITAKYLDGGRYQQHCCAIS